MEAQRSLPPRSAARIPYIDALRIFAAFFVIVNHTNSRLFNETQPSLIWYSSITYFFASKSAVPVFLMITGALSVDRAPDWKGYPRRVLRALVVLAAASFVYYVHTVLTRTGATFTLGGLTKAVFQSAAQPFWYLYVYLACTLFMPFFQKLASVMNRREERLFLLLCLGLNGLLELLPLISPVARIHDMYGAATVNSYIGLVFAGHYCHKYLRPGGRTALWAALVWAAILALEVWLTGRFYHAGRGNFLVLEERTMPHIVIQAFCVFQLFRWLFRDPARHPRLTRAVCFAGRQTFGIFLLGELGIRYLGWIYTDLALCIPRLAAMVIYEAAVFLACMLVTALLRTIPPVRRYL